MNESDTLDEVSTAHEGLHHRREGGELRGIGETVERDHDDARVEGVCANQRFAHVEHRRREGGEDALPYNSCGVDDHARVKRGERVCQRTVEHLAYRLRYSVEHNERPSLLLVRWKRDYSVLHAVNVWYACGQSIDGARQQYKQKVSVEEHSKI